jgi:phosphoenolpyruvate carboxykinase (ATP)
MVLPPITYAKLLGERVARYNVDVWLVNTGWSGGPYGVGNRMNITYTRAMVRAVLSGSLRSVPTRHDASFNLEVPISCAEVPSEVLDPRRTWTDPAKYDLYAAKLATMFRANFKRFAAQVPAEVAAAGPQLAATHM